jgi:hypothetical protein
MEEFTRAGTPVISRVVRGKPRAGTLVSSRIFTNCRRDLAKTEGTSVAAFARAAN